ncbi:MAG: hypothetical protein AAGA77_01875 [Bacteroidota bacterium]
MNHILKAIKDYPEAFELEYKGNDSLDDHLKIILSAKKLGTSIQQDFLLSTKLFFGWNILIKLGLRSIAIPMGIEMLETCNWNNHYHLAAELCRHIMIHYYGFENIKEAEEYERMFKKYRETYNLESEMESLYCKLFYRYEHGLEIDKALIEKDIHKLEARLQFDSCKYHYYYFHCKCILSKDAEYEDWCLKALAYFQNLYFKHEIYLNIFVKQLYTYYLSINRYKKVLDEIPSFISDTTEGSKSWYRLKLILITSLLNMEDIKQARKEIDHCLELKGYQTLSEAHQQEWQYLADTIYQKTGYKVTTNNDE